MFFHLFLLTLACTAEIMLPQNTMNKWVFFFFNKLFLRAPIVNWHNWAPECVTLNIFFVCLFTLHWVAPCVDCKLAIMTYTTNIHIIVIPWSFKAGTVGKAPLSLTPTTLEWAGCLHWSIPLNPQGDIFSRPWQSQGLHYKQPRHLFINWLIQWAFSSHSFTTPPRPNGLR